MFPFSLSAALPVLLRPRMRALKNRWRRRQVGYGVWARDTSIAFLTLLVIVGSYFATHWVLTQTKTQLDFVYIPASLLLGLILTFLLVMLFVTNTVSALGELYFAKDLSLILSSPISATRFFFGKFWEVMLGSSWMTMVFLLPVVVAFGSYYRVGVSYYVFTVLVLIPYFVIPAACSVALATISAILIPVKRRKEVILLFFGAPLVGLFYMAKFLSTNLSQGKIIDLSDILRVVSFLSVTNRMWTPAFWVSSALGEKLEPQGAQVLVYLLLLYAASFFAIALAFLAVRTMFTLGYARLANFSQRGLRSSKYREHIMSFLFGRCRAPTRALAEKEVKVVIRDVTQAVQFILLLGICGFYLYSLSIQGLFSQVVPEAQQRWWRVFLIVVNVCIEAFVITAMGSRFVFPSVSREGRSFWVLQTAPLSMKKMLRVKYVMWLIPISLVTSIVFGSAVYLVTGRIELVLLKVAGNCLLNIGIVGLAVGFGAYFANFNYEHIAQVTTSFGSLVYMLCAVLLIVANIVITAMAYYFGSFRIAMGQIDLVPGITTALFLGVLLISLNLIAALVAIRMGEKALEGE